MPKAARNRIRVVRADKRITQMDIQLATGITQSKLSLIENLYVEPTPDEREALAKALGVSEAELFPTEVAS